MPGAVYKNPNRRKASSEARPEKTSARTSLVTGSAQPNVRTARSHPRAESVKETPPPKAALPTPEIPAPSARGRAVPPNLGRDADNVRKEAREKADATPPARASVWTVRLTPSILIMLGMLLVVTLTFFFGFGIIVGRGMVPLNHPAPLERLVPEIAPHESESPERILPEEDLRFMAHLRAEGTDTSALLPTEGQTPAAPAPQVTQAMPPATPPAARPPAGTAPDAAKYDFVLQVATFRAEESANVLRLKLEENGIRSKIYRSESLFAVQVLYRGTTENFQPLRDGLRAYGIHDSFLVSKTPVP